MINKDPALCRVSKFHQNPAVKNAVNRYIVAEYAHLKPQELIKIKRFKTETGYLEPVVLYGLSTLETDVPAFAAPYINKDNNWIALDARQLVVSDRQSLTARVKNDADYQFAVQRFVLTGMFYSGKHNSLYNMRLPHIVFADWLSTSLARKFSLDMGDQYKLYILASIYYATLFTDHFGSEELDKLKVVTKSEITVTNIIDQVYNDAGSVNSIDDFCSACYNVTRNVRLQNLDFGVLVSVVSNSWFGLNAQESILLALEHPPTWIAMVYTACTQKSQRNSNVARLADSRGKRGVMDDFLKELVSVTLEYKED